MFDPNAQQGQDPASAYSQLDQGQKSQIAQAFMQRFAGTNDPRAQQYAKMDPNAATPGQLAEMHQYAAQNHPGILGDVLKHPVITAALSGFAAYELDKRLGGKH
ncbi:MAG TPA: hypothetical protein VE338_10960 [Ktedonobacterales bacterium]|jgi:hypothetical protein|nr:hypothetical protein [Ktedonobacterales bacterium]